MELTDSFGRKINYLRLSITDRCNMRCVYCMPAAGVQRLEHSEILSYEELLRIAEAAVKNGVEKIRITGGEPLVRKGIVEFLQRLAPLPGLRQLVLTTNALHLPEMAHDLRRAGVQRLNISLDSLQGDTFARITRGGDLQRVLSGIDAAGEAGFSIKINVVVMRGVNDSEILDFVELTQDKGLSVRFIEYMPVVREPGWEQLVVPGGEILERIGKNFDYLPQERDGLAGPARVFRTNGAAGSFGIITPVSGHFCAECNRIRVTATGRVKGCLFADESLDLKPLLASGDAEALVQALRDVICNKPRNHSLNGEESTFTPFTMASIGG